MAKKFDQEGSELAQKLSVSVPEQDGEKMAREVMRQVMYEFFQQRVDFIRKNEELRLYLEQDIRKMIEDDKLSPTQKLSVWKFITTANNQATKILLDGIKPNPNTTSNLLDDSNPYDDNDYSNNMSPKELEAVHKLISISKKGSTDEDND